MISVQYFVVVLFAVYALISVILIDYFDQSVPSMKYAVSLRLFKTWPKLK